MSLADFLDGRPDLYEAREISASGERLAADFMERWALRRRFGPLTDADNERENFEFRQLPRHSQYLINCQCPRLHSIVMARLERFGHA